MKSIGVVHIGDIHYPEYTSPDSGADIKDKGFVPGLVEGFSPRPLKQAGDHLLRLLENKPQTIAILFSGDLTSWAQDDKYQECVQFLMRLGSGSAVWKTDAVRVVPGNHDVDRARAHGAKNLAEKFEAAHAAWATASFPVLKLDPTESITAEREGCKAVVYPLNSCVGCGEKRFLPSEVKDKLAALLRKYVSDMGGLRKAFDLVGEKLDTPAFLADHLNDIQRSISASGPDVAAIILSHHPLLPQAVFRAEVYTELVNSGLARVQLTGLHRPVVYCHGHIHQSPVEIIRDPEKEGAAVISVSAPLFVDGFNYLEFHYGRTGGLLGLEVVRQQRRHGVRWESQEAIRIPFETRGTIQDSIEKLILAKLRNLERFPDLAAKVRRNRTNYRDPTIGDRLLELEWKGFLQVRNRNEAYHAWQIEPLR